MARKRKKDPAVVGKEVASRPGPVAVVWTLDRVKSRCEVKSECWIWQGKCAKGKTPKVAIDKRSVSVPKWVLEQSIGRKLARGQYARLTCGVHACVSPHCVEVGRIAVRNREALARKKPLLVRNAETRLRNRAHALSMGWGKLTLELARQIRANVSTEGGFAAAVAQHSAAASRGNGGRLDWMPLSNLPPTVAPFVLALGAGEVSDPLPIPGGVALFQFGLGTEFWSCFAVYLIIQALDGNLLVPVLFSEAVNLHPLVIILSVVIFGGLWGFWGVFFAIPLATLIKAVMHAWPDGQVVDEP